MLCMYTAVQLKKETGIKESPIMFIKNSDNWSMHSDCSEHYCAIQQHLYRRATVFSA